MIKKIGVENFRVFKDYTEFEIRPITLLTGPNNSGKSSFTKLLLLLQNGLEQLDFKKGKHNLESFPNVLNWNGENPKLRVRLNSGIPIFKNIDVDFIYEESVIKGINLVYNDTVIIAFNHRFEGAQVDWEIWSEGLFNYQNYTVNIEYLLDLIYDNQFRVAKFNKDYNSYSRIDWINAESPNLIPENSVIKKGEIDKTNYRENFLGVFDENPEIKILHAIKNEVNKLQRDYILYEVSINGENKTSAFSSEIRELQKIAFQNLEFHDDPEYPAAEFDTDIFDRFVHNLSEIQYRAEEKFQELLEEKYPNIEITVKSSPLASILFEEKWFSYQREDPRKGKTLFEQFELMEKSITKNLEHTDFISANRGSQKRVLQNNSENEIDKLIVDFIESGEKNREFIHEVFKILNIKGTLQLERYQNTISVVYLEYEGRRTSLADLGYGFSQLIPIILKIILSNKVLASQEILIIEEPEANLHPALQSNFADILILSIRKFPKKTFILETHSEYLIRKLQYLTAKKDIETNETVIYYFNADEYVTHDEPKVKKIEITETGNLTENFGPGFFDEATRLQFDLMKMKKEKKN